MGRETYTFTLNHQKLSTTLADKLEAELNGDRLPFGKFVEEADLGSKDFQRDKFGLTQPLTAEQIIQVLRSKPERADILHLSIPFKWLWDFYQISSNGRHEQIWLNYGYEMVYEFDQKHKCWVYMSQICSHHAYNDILDDREKHNFYDGTYLHDHLAFKDALNYLLILLKKLWQAGPDSKYMASYTPQELALPTGDFKDERLEQQTDEELECLKELNKIKDSYEFEVPESMFFQIKELQLRVQHYKGKIFIWDSV